MWAVRARGGVGTHWQPFFFLSKHQENASQVCVVARKRGPGGVGGGGGEGAGGVWARFGSL